MKWDGHICKTVKKANGILGFLRRNLKHCPTTLKETAYKSLVRSILDYGASIWDPYLKKDILDVEAVQRRAARFVTGDYSRYSSVTSMLNNLKWQSLESRRREARLSLLFKVVHGLVAVPHEGHISKSKTRTRAKNSLKLNVYAPKTEIFRSSFFPRTVKEWNTLPDSFVTADTVDTFKNRLYLHFD